MLRTTEPLTFSLQILCTLDICVIQPSRDGCLVHITDERAEEQMSSGSVPMTVQRVKGQNFNPNTSLHAIHSLKQTKDVCSQEHPGSSTLYASGLPAIWELRYRTSLTKYICTDRIASPHTHSNSTQEQGSLEKVHMATSLRSNLRVPR